MFTFFHLHILFKILNDLCVQYRNFYLRTLSVQSRYHHILHYRMWSESEWLDLLKFDSKNFSTIRETSGLFILSLLSSNRNSKNKALFSWSFIPAVATSSRYWMRLAWRLAVEVKEGYGDSILPWEINLCVGFNSEDVCVRDCQSTSLPILNHTKR